MSTSDRFTLPCPTCRTEIGVSRAHIGKKGRCPKCQAVFPIVAPAEPGLLDLQPLPGAFAQGAPSWSAPAQPSYGQPTYSPPSPAPDPFGGLPNPYGANFVPPQAGSPRIQESPQR